MTIDEKMKADARVIEEYRSGIGTCYTINDVVDALDLSNALIRELVSICDGSCAEIHDDGVSCSSDAFERAKREVGHG